MGSIDTEAAVKDVSIILLISVAHRLRGVLTNSVRRPASAIQGHLNRRLIHKRRGANERPMSATLISVIQSSLLACSLASSSVPTGVDPVGDNFFVRTHNPAEIVQACKAKRLCLHHRPRPEFT